MKEDATGRVRIAARIRRLMEAGEFDTRGCRHVDEIQDVTPSASGCEDCLKIGDTWVQLRLCLTCGYVGCCNSSKNKHASSHYRQTEHPIIVSYEEGAEWLWCYIDKVTLKP